MILTQLLMGVNLHFIPRVSVTGNAGGAIIIVENVGGQNNTTIQAVVDNASAGDVLYIYNGTYLGNVLIDKPLTIIGNGSGSTHLKGSEQGDVISIRSNWVNISGLNISKGGKEHGDAGIGLNGSDNCNISNNLIFHNREAISLFESSGCVIFGNEIISSSSTNATNWSRREKITISSPTPIEDYQLKIELDAVNFDYSKAMPGGEDLRFTDRNRDSLHYWIETWDDTGTSTVWIRIPIKGTTAFYMLYGNPFAQSESDGANVFDLFDDFSGGVLDTDRWEVSEYQSGTHSYDVANGELHIYAKSTSDPSGYTFTTKSSYAVTDFSLHCSGRWTDLDYSRGAGRVFDLSLLDGDSHETALWVGLNGDNGVVIQRRIDNGSFECVQKVTNLDQGNASICYEVSGNQFKHEITGTYSYSDQKEIAAFSSPFRVKIVVYLDHWTGNVEENGYYDIICLRRNPAFQYSYTMKEELELTERYGIHVIRSENTLLRNNSMVKCGVYIEGSALSHWNSHDMDGTNKINGNPLRYMSSETGGNVQGGAGQVILADCSFIIVEELTVENCTAPILLGYSDNNTIRNNTCSFGNIEGIGLYRCSDNNLSGNVITRGGMGINSREGGSNIYEGNRLVGNSVGISISDTISDRLSNNTLENNRIGMGLPDTSKVVIDGNNISRSLSGILMLQVTNAVVEENHVWDSFDGISLISGDIVFEDNFDDGDRSGWSVSGAGQARIGKHVSNSSVYSMYTRKGEVRVTSPAINLTDYDSAYLQCWVRRGNDSFSDAPRDGDDLVILYKDAEGIWHDLVHYNGNGNPGEIYTPTLKLPPGAMHSRFLLRFYQTSGGGSGKDYWHIDDVRIIWPGSCGNAGGNLFRYNRLTDNYQGIHISGSDSNEIHDNNITSESGGRGIVLRYSEDNTVRNNELSGLENGIELEDADLNTVRDNRIRNTDSLGIYAYSSLNNTIENNTCLSGGVVGIRLYYSDGNTLSNNNCSNNDVCGISILRSRDTLLDRNRCCGNHDMGVSVYESHGNIITAHQSISNDGCGLYLTQSGFCRIENCTFRSNGEYGLLVSDSDNGIVTFSNCSGNANDGIFLQDCERYVIENCSSVSNEQDGITIYRSDYCDVLDNTFVGNKEDGLSVDNGEYTDIYSNRLSGNDDDGLYLANDLFSGVERNVITSNGAYGIRTAGAVGINITNNTIGDNDAIGQYLNGIHYSFVLNNTCIANGNYGIFTDGSHDNEFGNNTCNSNGDTGIYLDDSNNNKIIGNNCSSNDEHGLYLRSSNYNRLINNTCSNNNKTGLHMYDSDHFDLTGNIIEYNLEMGVRLDLSGSGKMMKNIDRWNNDGLSVYRSSGNYIFNNTFESNKRLGIHMDLNADNNKVHDNIIRDNDHYGINVTSNADNNRIHHNNFINNRNGAVQSFDAGTNTKWSNDTGTGNFWSDHHIRYPDASGDGDTWDIPYWLDGGILAGDQMPLMFVTFVDANPPVLTDDNSGGNLTTGEDFTFEANVTDDIAVIDARVCYTFDNELFENMSLQYMNNYIWSNSTKISPNATFLNYYFTVLDAGGNWMRFDGRNAPVEDNDLPEMTNISTDGEPATGAPFELTARILDNIGVNTVSLNYSFDGRASRLEPLIRCSPTEWKITIEVPAWATFLGYELYFVDVSGNSNATSRFSENVVDNCPPFMQVDAAADAFTGDAYLFSGEFRDNVNLTAVWVDYSFDSVSYTNRSMLRRDGSTWELEIEIGSRVSELYYLYVFNDSSGIFNRTPVTHLAVIDNDVPFFRADFTKPGSVTGGNLTFCMEVTDNVGTTSVHVNYTDDNISYHNVSMNPMNGFRWERTIELSESVESVRYTFHFSDGQRNTGRTDARIISVSDVSCPSFIRETPGLSPATGKIYFFKAVISDNVGVRSVSVDYTFDGMNMITLPLNRDEGGDWNGQVVVPSGASVIEYYYFYEDTSGNAGRSPIYTKGVSDVDAPVVNAGPGRFVERGETVAFNGSGSSDNMGLSMFIWSFMYNGYPVKLTGETVLFDFLIAGNYTILLAVTDLDGNQAFDTIRIDVNDTYRPPPEIENRPEPVDDDDVDDDDDDDKQPEENNGSHGSRSESSIVFIIVPLILLSLIIIAVGLIVVLSRDRLGFEVPFLDKGKAADTVAPAQPGPLPAIPPGLFTDTLTYGNEHPSFYDQNLPEPLRYTLPSEREYRPGGAVAWNEEIPRMRITGETGETQRVLPAASISPVIPEDIGDIAIQVSRPLPIDQTSPWFPMNEGSKILQSLPLREDAERILAEPADGYSAGTSFPPPPPPPPQWDSGVITEILDSVGAPLDAGLDVFKLGGKKKTPSVSRSILQRVMLFRLEESMPCSICFGDISEGLQALRCSCGNISHLSCGIKAGRCFDCGTDYEAIMDQASEEAILRSVEDSGKTAKREVEDLVDWDEKDDMVRTLLKQVINKEITIDEYKLLVKDIKDNF